MFDGQGPPDSYRNKERREAERGSKSKRTRVGKERRHHSGLEENVRAVARVSPEMTGDEVAMK